MPTRRILITFLLFVFIMAGCGVKGKITTESDNEVKESAQEVEGSEIVEEESVQQEKVEPLTIFEIPWDDYHIYSPALIESAQGYLENAHEVSQYRIAFTIADDMQSLMGHQEIYFVNQEEAALNEIYLRLFPNIVGGSVELSNLQINGQDAEFVLEAANSSARIPLDKALPAGEDLMLSMDFVVGVPTEMGGNYGLFGYFDEYLVLDLFYPVIPAYDELGWFKDLPSEDGDISYFDASYYLVEVTAPKNLTVVAAGVEVDWKNEDGKQVVTFAQGPARDFYVAASQHFSLMSEAINDEITVNCYAPEEFAEGQAFGLNVAAEAIRVFSEDVGEYEYTEFDVISTPMLALGIEYPGLTGINLVTFDPEGRIAGFQASEFLESTIAHEVGHHWFYNVVGNDQGREPWLDEAVVQFLTGEYFKSRYGTGGFNRYRQSWLDRWARVDSAREPIGLPAGEYERGHYGAIVYGRGPLFVEALSKEMGEEVFYDFLRDYYESNHWGIGQPIQFQEMAEQHCDCDLQELFDEWVFVGSGK